MKARDVVFGAIVLVSVVMTASGCGGDQPAATPLPSPVASQAGLPSSVAPPVGDPPPGNPAPENLPPGCAPQAIAQDLDDIGGLGNENATVSDCDGTWAVIGWDVPGDTLRIVHKVADRWATYVAFPHDVCWTKAAADGAPARYQEYFIAC
ncbi:hypothetical protein [Nocardia altamirensis]|uniref:hypothetical protein n=1 Tax=Nocardia altamirensis TaxID=472158 RepID=UPI0008407CCF|nr:hypothetical protein [Nocardia altamirensis]